MARLEKTVYDVVVSVVADYSRMKKLLEKDNLTRQQAAEFTRKVSAVDNALIAVCDGETEEVRDALRSDIAHRRGFQRGAAKKYYTFGQTYEKRKSDAVRMIAKMLDLI